MTAPRTCANTRCFTGELDADRNPLRTTLDDGTGICTTCHRRLLGQLDDLVSLYIDLSDELQPGRKAIGPGGGGYGSRTPYNDEALHLMEETVKFLEEWATWIRDERDLTHAGRHHLTPGKDGTLRAPDGRLIPDEAQPAVRVREGFALTTLLNMVRGHVDFVTTRPDERPGEDLVREVAELIARIRFHLGAWPRKTYMANPCPSCGWLSLVIVGEQQHHGCSDVDNCTDRDCTAVDCSNPSCSHTMTLAAYTEYAETVVTAHRRARVENATLERAHDETPLTARDAAELVGVSVDLIWQWKKRGLLKANATAVDGKPRFLAVDVLRAEHKTRTAPAGGRRRAQA